MQLNYYKNENRKISSWIKVAFFIVIALIFASFMAEKGFEIVGKELRKKGATVEFQKTVDSIGRFIP